MAIFQSYTLLSATAVTASSSGSASGTNIHSRGSRWAVLTTVGTVSGTTPTLDITIEHSLDNVNWVTLTTITQRTDGTASSALHTLAASATDYLKPVLPYVRAKHVIGGTNTPTFNNVSVKFFID